MVSRGFKVIVIAAESETARDEWVKSIKDQISMILQSSPAQQNPETPLSLKLPSPPVPAITHSMSPPHSPSSASKNPLRMVLKKVGSNNNVNYGSPNSTPYVPSPLSYSSEMMSNNTQFLKILQKVREVKFL
jgi:hypothetical protein